MYKREQEISADAPLQLDRNNNSASGKRNTSNGDRPPASTTTGGAFQRSGSTLRRNVERKRFFAAATATPVLPAVAVAVVPIDTDGPVQTVDKNVATEQQQQQQQTESSGGGEQQQRANMLLTSHDHVGFKMMGFIKEGEIYATSIGNDGGGVGDGESDQRGSAARVGTAGRGRKTVIPEINVIAAPPTTITDLEQDVSGQIR